MPLFAVIGSFQLFSVRGHPPGSPFLPLARMCLVFRCRPSCFCSRSRQQISPPPPPLLKSDKSPCRWTSQGLMYARYASVEPAAELLDRARKRREAKN